MEPENLVCREMGADPAGESPPRTGESRPLSRALLVSVFKPSRANGRGHSPPTALFELMLLGSERAPGGGRGAYQGAKAFPCGVGAGGVSMGCCEQVSDQIWIRASFGGRVGQRL